MTDTTSDTSRIERDLNHTRERLSADLDALQRRFSPGQMVDEALTYVPTDAVRDFAGNLGRSLQANPVPVALVGVGLAWLIFAGNDRARRGGRTYEYDYGHYGDGSHSEDLASRASRAAEALSRTADETADAFRLRMLEAKGRILGVTRSTDETADAYSARIDAAMDDATARFARMRDRIAAKGRAAYDAAYDTVASGGQAAYDSVSTGGGAAYDTVASGGQAAYDTVASGGQAAYETAAAGGRAPMGTLRSGVDSLKSGVATGSGAVVNGIAASSEAVRAAGENAIALFQRNPLLMGALGITVGAVIGLALPSTRQEDEVLGPYRDQARDRLREGATDAMDHAGRVVDEVVDAGSRVAADLQESGRKAVGEITEAGKKAAADEGLIRPRDQAPDHESTQGPESKGVRAGAAEPTSYGSNAKEQGTSQQRDRQLPAGV